MSIAKPHRPWQCDRKNCKIRPQTCTTSSTASRTLPAPRPHLLHLILGPSKQSRKLHLLRGLDCDCEEDCPTRSRRVQRLCLKAPAQPSRSKRVGPQRRGGPTLAYPSTHFLTRDAGAIAVYTINTADITTSATIPFPLNRRLTVAERNRIVNMLATDTNPKKIADDTHCSHHTVMRIKRNLKLFDNHTPLIKARQGRPPKLNEIVLEVEI